MLPDGATLSGLASAVDPAGRLVVRNAAAGAASSRRPRGGRMWIMSPAGTARSRLRGWPDVGDVNARAQPRHASAAGRTWVMSPADTARAPAAFRTTSRPAGSTALASPDSVAPSGSMTWTC